MLVDQFGRALVVPATTDLEAEVSAPSMGSVRQIASGHPADGITPARLGALLRGAETGDATAYLELAEQMEEKDLHYSAVLGVRKRAIRRLKFVVKPASDAPKDEEAAKLVRDALRSSAIKDDLIDMLDAIGKGYSATEIIWNTKAKPWTVSRLEWRDPRWFAFDPVDGRTPLLRDAGGDLPLPPFKFVFHLAKTKSGLPIRGGLARLVAWAYVFKNYSIKDWAIFMEAYGHPIRIGKYGPSASPADKATLLRAVRAIGTDLAAIIPQSMTVDLVSANVTGAGAMFKDAAEYWDRQISKAVLGQVSTTDAIAGGHAVGKVHDEVRSDIRDADAEQLASTLQRDIAVPITFFNLGADAQPPILSFEAEEEQDPRMMMAAIREFGPRGLKVPVTVVRDAFGIREPDEGEEVLDFSGPAPDAGGAPGVVPITAAARGHAHARSALDEVTAALIASGSAQASMDPWVGGLLDAIETAASIEDVRDMLADAATAAPDGAIRELLARLTFNGRLAGEIGANVG